MTSYPVTVGPEPDALVAPVVSGRCPTCSGRGVIDAPGLLGGPPIPCPVCAGTGIAAAAVPAGAIEAIDSDRRGWPTTVTLAVRLMGYLRAVQQRLSDAKVG